MHVYGKRFGWAGLAAAVLLLIQATAVQAGIFDAWTYKMKVTFSGYAGGATLTNLPVLVVLTPTMAGSAYNRFASSGGNDLRFTTADGNTELSYEIDTWNTAGNSYVWVKVPALASSSDYIWAYWGNSGAAGSPPAYTQNGGAWNSQFTGVYHMDEVLSNEGTGGVNYDATSNGRNGTQNYTAHVSAGVIGGAQESDQRLGTSGDEYIRLPGATLNAGAYTKEIWFRHNGTNNGAILNGSGGGTALGLTIAGASLSADQNGSDPLDVAEATALPARSWQYCVATYDSAVSGGTLKLYRNGTQVGLTATSISQSSSPSDMYVFSTGGGWNAGGRGDEVRLSNVARSWEWIQASYQTVSANGSFQTYDAVQGGSTNPVSGPSWSAYNDFYQRSGDPTANLTTNNFLSPTSGGLVNYADGSTVGVTMQCSPSGGAFGDFNNTANPPVGSDAYVAFNGKVGLTNYTFISTGASNIGPYTLQFTGLDANAAYTFVLFGTRGYNSAQYLDRFASLTVQDVDVFTNSSSSAATKFQRYAANDSAELVAGGVDGAVWRFDGLRPGADGDMQFDLYGRGTNGQTANIYLGCFMLQAMGSTNSGGTTNTPGASSAVYWKGTAAPAGGETAWRSRIYDVSTWTAGEPPYWFGDGSGGTQLTDMQNSYATLYTRIPFVVTNAASVQEVTLTIDFDDAFTAWIEGVKVASSSNAPASPTYASLASPDHESSVGVGGTAPEVHHITGISLTTGTNYLAIQGFNVTTGSSDFVLIPTIQVVYQGGGGTSTGSYGVTGVAIPPVMINEWMPFNRSFNTDNAGDNDPWIELKNTTATNISLQNWRLSDDLANSSKFTIPSGYSLSGGAHLLIWADNETGETSGGNLHCNFRLLPGGGSLALFNSTGGVVDAVAYDPQASDSAGGRTKGGDVCDTAYPTPASSNNTLEVIAPTTSGDTISMSTSTRKGHGYRLEVATSIASPSWSQAGYMIGNGSVMSTSVTASVAKRFYRMVKETEHTGYVPNTNVAAVMTALNSSSVNLIKTASLSQTVGGTSGGSLDDMRNGAITWETSNWYPDRLHGAKVRATWGAATTVDRVWLYGCGSTMQGVQRGRVWLSNGSVYEFGPIPDRTMVPGVEISFPAQSVTWVEVEIVQGRARGGTGSAGGIGEWAIFNGMPAGVTHTEWFAPRTWHDTPPAGCTFAQSSSITGMVFTGRHIEYQGADTWYPVQGPDGYMYSCYADGFAEGIGVTCYGAESTPYQNTTTGNAKILGDDPMDLQIAALSASGANTGPYHARYPAGSLYYNGVWFYGTYACNYNTRDYTDGNGTHAMNWPICGALCGFRYSSDKGQSWTDTAPYPRNGQMGVFDEPSVNEGPIKFGTPHFADLGYNLQYSDGYAYLCGHGTQSGQTNRFSGTVDGNVSWITGDGIYLSRLANPTPSTINNTASWQYFAGLSGTNATWTSDLSQAKPIAWWDNHMGCVTITYNPGLKKYLMCVTDGRYTCEDMDSYVMEADQIYGPYRMVNYMAAFGEQAYFLNMPSKFISNDGKTAWLSYSANFRGWGTDYAHPTIQPEASRYAWCLVEVKFLTQ